QRRAAAAQALLDRPRVVGGDRADLLDVVGVCHTAAPPQAVDKAFDRRLAHGALVALAGRDQLGEVDERFGHRVIAAEVVDDLHSTTAVVFPGLRAEGAGGTTALDAEQIVALGIAAVARLVARHTDQRFGGDARRLGDALGIGRDAANERLRAGA